MFFHQIRFSEKEGGGRCCLPQQKEIKLQAKKRAMACEGEGRRESYLI